MTPFTKTAALAPLMLGAATLVATPAGAAITISTDSTSNVTCTAKLCVPTAADAVLNVTQLENLLANSSVTIKTSFGGVHANDIVVDTPISWSSSRNLNLSADERITVQQPVTVAGKGGLSLNYRDKTPGGRGLVISHSAYISFSSLESRLTMNGKRFVLEGDIASLARDAGSHPEGNYAMAASYDASADGTYSRTPVATLSGTFEGLGNTLSNLSIDDSTDQNVGLFGQAVSVRDIVLDNAIVHSASNVANVGTLCGQCTSIENARSSGSISAEGSGVYTGGLVGYNSGNIFYSSSSASLTDSYPGGGNLDGGLAGYSFNVAYSFATGDVSSANSDAGGLTGSDAQTYQILASYARGAVTSRGNAHAGGLIGNNLSKIRQTYSTGAVQAPSGHAGGFMGNMSDGSFSHDYWDRQTAGQTQDAANVRNVKGVRRSTTAKLQAGLPEGFDPAIWASDPNVNNGYPYLIGNPPSN